MMCFIASETFFLHHAFDRLYLLQFLPASEFRVQWLNPLKTGIFTFCLLASSLTYWAAEKKLEAGNQKGFVLWLAATLVLGGLYDGPGPGVLGSFPAGADGPAPIFSALLFLWSRACTDSMC
jgi:heme/copper-type cytochrome/quinol oxidase subunit 3